MKTNCFALTIFLISSSTNSKLNAYAEINVAESFANPTVAVVKSSMADHRGEEKISSGDLHYVSSYRAYFHTAPGHDYINPKKYLVKGDYCRVLSYKNGFGYVKYYNTKYDKTTVGWLDLDDLQEEGGC